MCKSGCWGTGAPARRSCGVDTVRNDPTLFAVGVDMLLVLLLMLSFVLCVVVVEPTRATCAT